jgi:carboxymethylenebutenolidase
MTTPVSFSARDGRPIEGALALPPGATPAPAVIVAHEWWGLNADIRRLTDRFAAEGFVALAPDLYHGEQSDDRSRARELAGALKTPVAMDDIAGCLDFLAAHPRVAGRKIGITGFCLGGAMALAAGCNLSGLSAIVPFYGLPLPQYADWTRLSAPVMGHYGSADPMFPPQRLAPMREGIAAAGGQLELHVYDAGHAFMRQGTPDHDAAADALAWDRTIAFLRAHL